MFTGLIEDVGTTISLRFKKRAAVLAVSTRVPLRPMDIGASIAVNGTCLTVVKKGRGEFTVDVSPETLKRTNLKYLREGTLVNIERPMRLQDRLGGHLVTGHVDAVGTIAVIGRDGAFTRITFRVPKDLSPLLVPKGSVAVDGISLTVNDSGARHFSVAIIPFTLQHTNLRAYRVGDKVNLETDLIGKYVQSFLRKRGHLRKRG